MKDNSSILIIDDEPNNFDVIEALLDSENYDLNYASSGYKALERLEIFQPDVILLDVMMPELNGIEVKLLRLNKFNIKNTYHFLVKLPKIWNCYLNTYF